MTCLSKSLILTSNESVLSTGRFTLLLVGAFPEILLNADSFFIITSYALKDVFPHQRSCIYFFFYKNPDSKNFFSHFYSSDNSVCRIGFTVIVLMFFYLESIFYDFRNCFYYFIFGLTIRFYTMLRHKILSRIGCIAVFVADSCLAFGHSGIYEGVFIGG